MIEGAITRAGAKGLAGEFPGKVYYGMQGPPGPAGPQGEQGPVGPQGPQGESGGIDVTGAMVGQTVKITAVDETGKPTAWGAADFPVSGGNLDAYVEGETLVFTESSTATIENETLIL